MALPRNVSEGNCQLVMPPTPADSVLREKGTVAGFLSKSYFFWSKRKGSKILVDR